MPSETTGVTGLAGRYATALFGLAEDQNALDPVAGDLATLKAMIEASPELARLVRSPVISADDKAKAMSALMERAGFGELTRRFVGVVAENRRLFALPDMIAMYLRLLSTSRGEVHAEVTSATPLNDEQVQEISSVLSRTVGGKIAVGVTVDPSILGGLVVKVGSRMFDSSLRSKLQRLELAMKGVG